MSRTWVTALERKGELRAVVDRDGVHHFARSEVLALARKRGRPGTPDGKLVREVFQLFEQGFTLPQIVMRTSQTPATVRVLWDEYNRPLSRPGAGDGDALAASEERSAELDEQLESLRARPPANATNGHARTNGKAAR